jgi:tRNA (guanine-N7-)-methyltransferase
MFFVAIDLHENLNQHIAMGRRSLRKVSPSLDLSHHFMRLKEIPRPWNPESLFGRPAPLEIEVGTGKGLFLRSVAAAHPEINYLGIEIAHRYAMYAAAELARRGLPNGIVISGDAWQLFEELIPDSSLTAVHVYFPDPWWKRRHKRRRVLQDTFARHIERSLSPGGLLHFWTDVEEYFHSGVAVIQQETKLEGPFEVPERPSTGDLDYHTHFERRTRLHGEPVFRSMFRKANAPA